MGADGGIVLVRVAPTRTVEEATRALGLLAERLTRIESGRDSADETRRDFIAKNRARYSSYFEGFLVGGYGDDFGRDAPRLDELDDWITYLRDEALPNLGGEGATWRDLLDERETAPSWMPTPFPGWYEAIRFAVEENPSLGEGPIEGWIFGVEANLEISGFYGPRRYETWT